jgi:bidirectional [NiFe] hydrogenase diaphorase subunit
MITISVDGRTIETDEGATLLRVCLDNDIYIPNLCFLDGMEPPPASCRLCFVEIEGMNGPVPSCTVKVEQGIVVMTDTPAVRQLQRSALRLLLSVHDTDCSICPANKRCALQRMAKFLKVGLKQKRLEPLLKKADETLDHPYLEYYPNRCVLCGRCVHVCREMHETPYLTFAKRGMDTVISFYGEGDLTALPCEGAPACVAACPVGAILLKEKQ